MAVRASFDNLVLDQEVEAGGPAPDFSELWEHRPAIQHLCEAIVGASNAEDVVQDTYLRALKQSGRLERRDSTKPWLATVARRRSLDELRAKGHLVFLPTPPEPSASWSDDPAQRVVNLELVERLHLAMDGLTERERRVLLRQVGQGLSLEAIALQEHTSVASVRSVLSRARRKLRSSLERGGMLATIRWRISEVVGPRAVRWLAPLDAALPLVSGELGRIVGALVVAVMTLFGSSVVPPPATLEVLDEPPAVAVAGPAGGRASAGEVGRGKRPPEPKPIPTPLGSPLVPLPPLVPPVPPPGPTDGGSQPEDAHIESLATGADGRTVLAGGTSKTTGTWVLYRSSDGGQTWSRLGTDSLVSPERHPAAADGTLLVAPRYPLDPRVFVLTGSFLQRSVDGGRTFSTVAPVRGSAAVLSPAFSSGDARLFVAGPPPAVFHDADDRLEPMTSTVPWAGSGGIAIGPRFESKGEVFVGGTEATAAGADQAALFVCRASACDRRSLVPGLSGAPQILVSRAAGGVVFAWKSDAVYRSTDDGDTFSRHPTPAGVAVNRLIESNGRIFLLGTRIGTDGDAFHVSADGGASWAAIGTGSPLQSSVAAAAALGRGRLIAAPVGESGVLCSDDGGATWRPRCGRS